MRDAENRLVADSAADNPHEAVPIGPATGAAGSISSANRIMLRRAKTHPVLNPVIHRLSGVLFPTQLSHIR